MPRFHDLTGQKFGRLTVVKFSHIAADMRAKWECNCECGKAVVVLAANLKNKSTQSCGCLQKEIRKKHGLYGTPEYCSWYAMKARCLRKTSKAFKNYGYRGITVCESWIESFDNFFADMGPKPSENHSLDRINNDGNYEPSNCRWADSETQSRNQRIQSRNTTGTRGVCWDNKRKKWVATIRYNSRNNHLGRFSDLNDAIKARKDAEEKYWK